MIPKPLYLLGVQIHPISMEDAASLICQYALSHQPSVYVTKPYVEFLDQAAQEPEITHLLNQSYLSLPDSVAIQWAAHYLYAGEPNVIRLFKSLRSIVTNNAELASPIPERFAGADFTWKLLEQAASLGCRVYLIGKPKQSSIEVTVKVISERLPELKLVGSFDGYAANTQHHELINALAAADPDIILVGTGFPRQELLMSELIGIIGHGVLIGEGGTFDYQSFGGHLQRAPAWMRHSGLEWLWRLILEPSRITRQAAIPRFIWRVFRSRKLI